MRRVLWIQFLFVLVTSAQGAAAQSVACVAFANGQALQLEKSPAGFWLIAIEDPRFGEFDVMIDPVSRQDRVRFLLAKFSPPKTVVSLIAGFDGAGMVQAEMRQGESVLSALCEREKNSALEFFK